MSQLREWVILGMSVVAFILLLKLGASWIPDQGVFGAAKRVITNI